MRALIVRLRRRGKHSIPLAERPLPSWPAPQDPWQDTALTIVIPPVREVHRG